MADLLPIAIFIKDTDSKLLLVNKACEAQWGMRQSDLCGTDGSQFFPSDQMMLFFAKDKEVFAGKCQVDFEETFWNATLKQNRLGHTFKNPIYDEFGQPLYLICATLDITEQKQAENYESFRSHLLEQLTEDKPLQIILENIVRELSNITLKCFVVSCCLIMEENISIEALHQVSLISITQRSMTWK